MSVVRNDIKCHAVLLPSLYSMYDCKLLLEYLCFKNNESREKIISSPDYLFCTKFAGHDVPIKIESVKQITSFAQGTAFGGYKVIVIEDLDNATNNALNALLKTLEEPPQNTVFYLMYSNARNLPLTISSRCYTVKENITNAEDFCSIAEFFGMEANFKLFASCGYDFDVYRQSIDSKDLSMADILQKVSANSIDHASAEGVMLQLEKMLRDAFAKTTNFSDMEKLECIAERFTALKFACEVFNTNRHASLIELTESIHGLAS